MVLCYEGLGQVIELAHCVENTFLGFLDFLVVQAIVGLLRLVDALGHRVVVKLFILDCHVELRELTIQFFQVHVDDFKSLFCEVTLRLALLQAIFLELQNLVLLLEGEFISTQLERILRQLLDQVQYFQLCSEQALFSVDREAAQLWAILLRCAATDACPVVLRTDLLATLLRKCALVARQITRVLLANRT